MSGIPRIKDFDDITFNPFFEDELAFGHNLDPYPMLAELRSKAPVHLQDYRLLCGLPPDSTMDDAPHYTVTSYAECLKAVMNPAIFSNSAYSGNLGASFGATMSAMDAPEHTRYRRLFQAGFMPDKVSKWSEDLVDPVINELIGAFADRGHADLVEEFTHHYPFNIIFQQLALPEPDRPIFHKLSVAQTLVMTDFEHGMEASRNLGDYFRHFVAARRANPGIDLVSVLATARIDGEQLPDEVLISFLRQLVNAGGDTTYRATSVMLVGLLSNPEQLEALRKDRSLIPQAVEEALRWDGPITFTSRRTTRDTTLGGTAIPAHSYIDVVLGAANRDPDRFPEPDRFNIFRPREHRHLAFASGTHVCVGQHLARVEMTRALNAVLNFLPGVRLDPEKPPPVIRGALMRVPQHIFVRFDRVREPMPAKH